MSALSIDEVLALRKAVQDKFGVYVHLHDACGAQSFSVDKNEMTEELRHFLESYFDDRGRSVVIGDDGFFSVRR